MKNIKNKIKILLAIFLLSSSSTTILAQTTSEILGEELANNIEELEQKEQEREEEFLGQLLLDIPSLTDNPSHIITFIDPSETNEGVQLEIDGKGFETISSPYSLPALAIGKHELRFKFVDKYGSPQILEYEIVIIPRPPIINSPVFEETFLEISGTGLASSDLKLILSSGRKIIVEETTIDGDGNWNIQVSNEELQEGIFTFTAQTRRSGYASNFAEPVTFEIGESESLNFDNGKEIYFSFEDLTLGDIQSILSNNIDLGLLVGASFILGFLISLLIFSVVKGALENRSVKKFEKKLNNGSKKKEMTLKEKLSQQREEKEEQDAEEEEKKKVKEKEEDKEEKEEEKEKKESSKKKGKREKKEKSKKEPKGRTEKILTKVDFLKDYKKFDPDEKDGEEKDNIEVKVTSKS